MKSQKLDDATEAFAKAIELDPNDMTALVNLADCHARTGKKDEVNRIDARLAAIGNGLTQGDRERMNGILERANRG